MSTGPKTETGKQIASMNATTHGLTAKNWLNAHEEDQYQALLDSLAEEYKPQKPTEQLLVERVAGIATRLQRFTSVENALFEEARQSAGRHGNVVRKLSSAHQNAVEPYSSLEEIKASLLGTNSALQDELESISDVYEVNGYEYVKQHLPETRKQLLANCRDWEMSVQDVINEELGCGSAPEDGADIASGGDDYSDQTDEELDSGALNADPESLQEYIDLQIAVFENRRLIAEVVEGYEHNRNLLVAMAMPMPHVMDRLMRYQTSLDRQFSKALGELLHVIDRRQSMKKQK